MSKEQIEEMAVTTCSLYRAYLDKACGGNSDCDFNCHHYDRCKKLYEKGYRKQSEGEWKKVSDKYPRYSCTACNHLYNNKEYKYCPFCGARMIGWETLSSLNTTEKGGAE